MYNECCNCKQCCNFTVEDLWDLPKFTEEDMKIISIKYNNIVMQKQNTTYVPKIIVHSSEYKYCPFLVDDIGCILNENKPIDCALWPFYIMRQGNQLMLVQDLSCHVLRDITKKQVYENLRDKLSMIIKIYLLNPDYIQPYNNKFKIWKTWRLENNENRNCI